MHRQAPGLRQMVLDKEHPSTITSMNNLALVVERKGSRFWTSLIKMILGYRDLLSLSAKTRILQLGTQQIDHCLGWGAAKAMGDLSGVISMTLKLY
jgi:hypothetical protein